VAERPHSYAEAMEAWRTSCPRLSVWEDAMLDGLIRLVARDGENVVQLTPLGRVMLANESLPARRERSDAALQKSA